MSVEARQLRHLAAVLVSNVDKKSTDGDSAVRLVNYTDVYYGDRITPALELMPATATTEQIKKFAVLPGDTIITKDSESADDIAIPAFVEQSEPDMVCGYHLALVRPHREVHPRFLNWAITSTSVKEQFSTKANGMTRYGLTYDAIQSVVIPTPHPDDQRRIADFLDDQVARIDELSASRQTQMSLIQESICEKTKQFAAGVFDEFDSQDCPIPWQGRMGWDAEVQSMARLMTLQRGVDLTADERRPGVVPVVTTAGIVGHHDTAISSSPGVIIGRYGSVGNVHWLDEAFWPHNTTLYVKDFRGNEPRWVYHVLNAFPYEMLQARAAVPGINRNELALEPAVWVPHATQRLACLRIDQYSSDADMALSKIGHSIELLNAYKRSLITAAVTGEFDVSTAAGRGIPA